TFRPDAIDIGFVDGTRLFQPSKTSDDTEREGYIDMMTALVANGLDAAEQGDWDRHRNAIRAIVAMTGHCIAVPNALALVRAELGYGAADFVVGDAIIRPELPDTYLAEYAGLLNEVDSSAALVATLK